MSGFNKIQVKRPNSSIFDLSHDHKLSMKMGELVPCYLQECLPGDKFSISQEAMFRMMPMLAPIMHKVDIFFHTFFTPNRILWDNWEKFITGGQEGDIPPAPPTMGTANWAPSELGDYLGLPTGVVIPFGEVSALPFAAYQRIWFEYYRDQNLSNTTDIVPLQDGSQGGAGMSYLQPMRRRAWEHDYFTSALPFAQKGDAVEIPLDLQGSIVLDIDAGDNPAWKDITGNPINALATIGTDVASDEVYAYDGPVGPGPTTRSQAFYDPDGSLAFGDDVSTATTINDLRTAAALQRWLEKNARGGSRYNESILVHFAVRSPDQRLQRPEYIGGSKATMAISEVLQTSATATGSATPQANMAGHGISVTGGQRHSYFCQEHGWIMTILSIRPKTAYQQGVPRHFTKGDRTEYYFPDFAFLGEQEIRNKEIYYSSSNADGLNENTFGYVPRYTEYRYNPARISGQMRTTLDFWHLGRQFAARPVLNETFITCTPDKRIFADTDEADDEIVAHIFHQISARRPIPFYGNPGGI